MDSKQLSSSNVRSYILRRFAITALTVVVAMFVLITIEDIAFRGLVTYATHTQVYESPGLVLYLAFLLASNLLSGNAQLGIGPAATVQLTLLLVLMAALVLAPLAIGAVAFANMVEQRIISEHKARDAERAQFYSKRNLMISDMAHDLRTPVMAIEGLAQALDDGMVADEQTQQRYLRSIKAKAEKMADLVNMLFDFVKLESDGYALDRKILDLPQLVLNEAAASYTDVEDAGMQLRIEVPEDPVSVYADETQLARVVANLIANAMRHNSPGTTIVVGLHRRAGVVDIIVADNGTRIESSAESLFEPFTREDAARAGGGSGLGLSIVKSIVDMHGYQIDLLQPYGAYTKAFIVTCSIEN